MVTIRRKQTTSHNPQMADMLDEAMKEKLVALHVQLPESLMKRLRLYAVEQDKSLKDVVVEMLENRV